MEEFKMKKGKKYLGAGHMYLVIKQIGNENNLTDMPVFNILNPEDAIAILFNARYKFEKGIDNTDLESTLQNEIGFAGRAYVAEIFTRAPNFFGGIPSIPFPYISNLTLNEYISLIESYNNNKTKGPSKIIRQP